MTELLIGFLAGAALTVLLSSLIRVYKRFKSNQREQAIRIESIDSTVGRVNRTAWDANARSLRNEYDISNLYKKVEKLEEWKAGEW